MRRGTRKPVATTAGDDNQDDEVFDPTDDGGWFEPYAAHARTLRQWFVAFGVAAPVALFANEDLAKVFAQTSLAMCVVAAFLIGSMLQVGLAMVYKFYNSAHYCSHLGLLKRSSTRFKLFTAVGGSFTLELVADVLTIFLLMFASFTAGFQVVSGYRESTKTAPSAAVSSVADSSSTPAPEPTAAAHSSP